MIPKTLAQWPMAFAEIRRDFGFSLHADRAVAERLAAKLGKPPYNVAAVLKDAKEQARRRTVWVLGAADSAREDLGRVPADAVLWAADGATTAALEARRVPGLITTDLDGNLDHEAQAARRGALVFLHAHGDNGHELEAHLADFPPKKVAGTCQVEPIKPLINPGGFTDGDRAVFLALTFGAKQVRLVGFDYKTPGHYSGRFDPIRKPRKLEWAKRLIDRLIEAGAPVIYG